MPTTKNAIPNIDKYIASFPGGTQKMLEQVRAAIRKAAPGAQETISYGMPSFTLAGKYLIWFAGYKNHIGVYPVRFRNKLFKKDFSFFKISGKGTIQLQLNKPVL